MTCINCPMGCQLDVETLADGTLKVTGNACLRGETYAKQEVTAPVRMVTGLVRIAGMRKPLPAKTKTAVPKPKIDAVLFAMHQATVQLPVSIGDVIIPCVAGTDIDVVATANMK